MKRCGRVLALSAALVGCAPENILIAESVDGGLDGQVEASLMDAWPEAEAGDDVALVPVPDAGTRSDAGNCFDINNCQPGWYCAKARCGDERGTCTLPPRQCDEGDLAPVCGCNGVTYYNDCLRQLDGIGKRAVGECGREERARPCGPIVGFPCQRGQSCSLSGQFDQCEFSGTVGEGKCWVLPSSCSETRDAGAVYQRCGNPRTPERECVSLCDAIRDGLPYAVSPNCRKPPTFP